MGGMQKPGAPMPPRLPQHCPLTHMNVGGHSAPDEPQPCGGGTQVWPKQHCPFLHTPGDGHSPPFGPQPVISGTH